MNDRAVSVALDYMLMLMIATVVLAGVVTVSGVLIGDQVDRGIEDELKATGESLAADLQDVERLVNTSAATESNLTLETKLPRHVSGESYRISYNASTSTLVLATTNPDIEVRVPVAVDRVESTPRPISGGPVTIASTNGSIEVTEA